MKPVRAVTPNDRRGSGLRIYLDTSVYNRPFDDQRQPRIWLETLAFAVILQMIRDGEAALVSSSVVEYENSRNPYPLRQRWVTHCLALATDHQEVNESIRKRALDLEAEGLKAVDALHVACTEASECDYFLTCDDRLIRRYQGKIEVLNPLSFVLAATGGSP